MVWVPYTNHPHQLPWFPADKTGAWPQHTGSGLARLRQWWSLFISNLRACGATSSSVVLRDTNSFPAVGFSKKWGYRGYHCVYIYIYFFFTCMHTWNICTRKADGTGWNIQFQLVVFFWASESPESTVGEFPPGVDWSQKIRTPKDWIWNSRKRVRPWFHGFPTDKLTPTFWKRFTTGPTFFFFGIFKP